MTTPARKFRYLFHWPLFINILFLLLLGLVNLYSATASTDQRHSPFFQSQLMWSGIGLGMFFVLLSFHYRFFYNFSWVLYAVALSLLVLVIFFGSQIGGQKNWLVLGPVRLQPSEFAKIASILLLARYFAARDRFRSLRFRDLIVPILILLLPTLLILIEKDVGAAAFFVFIGLSFFFLVGVPKRYLLLALVLVTAGGFVGYRHFLSDYQKTRIQTFLHPERDPRGSGYHLLQSKIAVGSGQWTGTGYLAGHLNKLKFLPERHTDFVFPVLAEEWGLVGASVVLLSFLALFIQFIQAAGKVKDPFGAYLILGVMVWVFWQCMLNLGGVLGLIPLAGVTLPFFSYGGSALLTTFLGLSLAMNAHLRRYMF